MFLGSQIRIGPKFCRMLLFLTVLLHSMQTIIGSQCSLDRNKAVDENTGCPDSCQCVQISSGLKVDCSGQSLVSVPTFLPNETTNLDLSHNNISRLQNEFVNCLHLQQLDLSFNSLSSFDARSVSQLPSLRQLDLANNKLAYCNVSFDHQLPNLVVLRLHHNAWRSSSSGVLRPGVIDRLHQLQNLSVDAQTGELPFGDSLQELGYLSSLEIYGGLKRVTNDTFRVLANSSINHLKIETGYELAALEPMSFAYFHQLETLDLSFNQALGFRNTTSSGWWGLQFTNIKSLILTRIISNVEQINEVYEDFVRHLNLTRLEKLIIDKNNIVYFETRLHINAPNLTYIDVSYNRLSNLGNFYSDMFHMRYLRYIDDSHQIRRYMAQESEAAARRGKRADEAHHSGPKKTTKPASNSDKSCKLQSFKWNPVCANFMSHDYNDSDSVFSMLIGKSFGSSRRLTEYGATCIPLPRWLEVVDLSENFNVEIRDLPACLFFGGSHFKLIDLRRNDIQRLVNPLVLTLPSRITVDLRDNRISCIAPDFIKLSVEYFGGRFVNIDFAGNELSEQLETDNLGETFTYLTSLNRLSLARNQIKSLPFGVFRLLDQLVVLNLSRNSLRLVEFQFGHMTKLSHIDLSFNLIASLGDSVMRNLTTIFVSNASGLTVNLLGNPFQCSCETLSFLHWMRRFSSRFVNYNQYSCTFINNKIVTISNSTEQVFKTLDFDCSKKVAVVISGCLFGLMLVLLAVSACCYRFRWEMRYWWLKLIGRVHDGYDPLPPAVFTYDAFVVYDSGDRRWVIDQLVPQLEAEYVDAEDGTVHRPLRLCVHERDFRYGQQIIGNIWKSLEDSRKAILVVSGGFTASQYCDYEMNLTVMIGVERGRDMFVPVLLGVPDARKMSSTLRRILRRLTYAEWSQNAGEQAEFWLKLRRSLADDR